MIPTLFGRVTAVLGDHARLHGILNQLREISNAPIDVRSVGDLVGLLREFHEDLREHFTAEEDDQYFGTLVTAVPALGADVDRLRAEHVHFLVVVEHLTQLAESSGTSHEFRRALCNFFDQFNAHELAENRLLEQFFTRTEVG